MNKADGDGTSKMEPAVRPVGSTELTLCKFLANGGTGVTVISLLFSKNHASSTLQTIISHLQTAHPLLRSRLRHNTATKTFSFVTLPAPFIKLQELLDASSTILQHNSPNSPFLQIVEHEINEDMWPKIQNSSNADVDVFTARLYHLENGMRVLAFQFLTVVMDRTAGASVLNEFLTRLASRDDDPDADLIPKLNTKVCAALEDLNPKKMAKGIWSIGRNLLNGAVTTIGLTNLCFKDTKSFPRSSRIIRLQLDQLRTQNLLKGCKSRGIRLQGSLAAASMIAAHSSIASRNDVTFGLITVFDCRSSLNPPLATNDIGFYSTGLITSHKVCSNESFWKLALKIHESFVKAKKTDNHFKDMEIGNYLFRKAIENPGLTPSSAQRTALLSVYEEPAIMNKDCWREKLGLEDFIFCGSAHGAGPSISIIDTIEDGRLLCVFCYPSPLHSREQVTEIVDKVENILVDASS
ncbi:unnamed protein product [Rhodiola kirilowii]